MKMVVLYGDYAARQADRLRRLLGDGYDIVPVPYDTPAERMRAVLAKTEIVVTNAYGPSDPPVPRLRLLQSPSAGMENVDAALLPPGCAIRTVAGHGIPMSEFVLCAMLDWRIGFRSLTSTVVDGLWSQRDWIKGPVHGEIHGATLGIVGFGHIGREIAIRARAFGMDVRALSRWHRERPPADLVQHCFAMDERDAFLAPCDFVAITLSLTAETTGMIDSSWLGAMKPDGVLINVARGDVVRQDHLYMALATKRIGGAIIDVWYHYPDSVDEKVAMADHPFHTLPNVVISPHGSGRTHQMFERRWIEIAANIRAACSSRHHPGAHPPAVPGPGRGC